MTNKIVAFPGKFPFYIFLKVLILYKGKSNLATIGNQNLTLVLFFCLDFFISSTTNGSDFPIKSVAGKSSADITVTERTPLTITSLFLCKAGFSVSSESISCLRAFSKSVNLKSGLKRVSNALSLPKGQYKSSK